MEKLESNMNLEFWFGKRVFLTGHTGFKGSWMSLWLQNMGAIVKGYALNPPSGPSLFNEAGVANNMESDIGDVRDYQNLLNSIQEFKPDIVFHMAAQPLVRLSYEIPIDTYATNVMGTVHLLEACRKVPGVKAIVNITSDKCYENQEWEWGYRENEPMGGHDPYSNSKGCAELVASSFRRSFFNPASYSTHGVGMASVRAGNVIGGGDWALDRLIPDILKAFEDGRKVEIRNPNSIRPWQHVLEPLSGYLVIAEKLFTDGENYSEAWNFGPKDEDAQSVQKIVETLVGCWGGDADWFLSGSEHPHEAHYLKLDCSKARMKLKWEPVWDLNFTLKKITEWHQAWLDKCDMRNHTLQEINEYMKARIGVN